MEKRLFFAFETKAPWPENYPEGKILAENDRHLTFVFLGNVDFDNLKSQLIHFPLPSFKVGLAGKFDQLLFLPIKEKRCASLHITWLEEAEPLISYREQVLQWLSDQGFSIDTRPWLSHVTIARNMKNLEEWKRSFSPLPMCLGSLHLFESLGNSQYQSLWNSSIELPLEEFEHTADIGYKIRGSNLQQLYKHAQTALAFSFPPILDFFQESQVENVEEMVFALNQMVTEADTQIGCPFKAVSFHGNIEEKNEFLEWEMIIDV